MPKKDVKCPFDCQTCTKCSPITFDKSGNVTRWCYERQDAKVGVDGQSAELDALITTSQRLGHNKEAVLSIDSYEEKANKKVDDDQEIRRWGL